MNNKLSDKYEFPAYLDLKKYFINSVMEKYQINDPDLPQEMLDLS